jgi:L-asparaginase
MASTLRRICLMRGPGTLPSQGRDRMDLTHYNVKFSGKGLMSTRDMVAAIPEVEAIAEIVHDDDGPNDQSTHEHLRLLARKMNGVLAREDIEGVVYVQGTNTLEETAYFLNLTVRSDKPLVIVGAQRPFTGLSTDAHLNLVNAIRVAACEEARGKGVVTVTNSEINAARDVTKTSTFQLQTFRSRDLGLLGYADPDRIVFYRAPLRRHTIHSEFDIMAIDALPPVEILYPHTGTNPRLARAAVALGAQGLVIAGIGAGALGLFSAELKALAAEGVIVARSARVGEGRVLPIGNAHEDGMVATDNLNAQKAAVLLALAMTRTRDPAELQRYFDEY